MPTSFRLKHSVATLHTYTDLTHRGTRHPPPQLYVDSLRSFLCTSRQRSISLALRLSLSLSLSLPLPLSSPKGTYLYQPRSPRFIPSTLLKRRERRQSTTAPRRSAVTMALLGRDCSVEQEERDVGETQEQEERPASMRRN